MPVRNSKREPLKVVINPQKKSPIKESTYKHNTTSKITVKGDHLPFINAFLAIASPPLVFAGAEFIDRPSRR